jgi:hypothetical protein
VDAQFLLDLRRATVESLRPDDDDLTDEEDIDMDSDVSSEDEKEEEENIPPPVPWTKECTPVTAPPLAVPAAVQLPHHHASTELQVFQCMLREHTVATIAANTVAYAHSKGASSTWQTGRLHLGRSGCSLLC